MCFVSIAGTAPFLPASQERRAKIFERSRIRAARLLARRCSPTSTTAASSPWTTCFPKPNSIVPVGKESFVEGLGDIACGVGYYKTSAPGDLSRTVREQHACAVVMGLQQSGSLYNACIRILDNTLFELDRAQLILTEQNACARLGLKPGTPSFAACVANGPGF